MAIIQQEGTPLAEPVESDKQETETPAEPPTDSKPTEPAPSTDGAAPNNQPVEKPVPYHKDSRWKAMRSENEQLKAAMQDLLAWRQQADQRLSAVPASQEKSIPQWFSKFFGDNQELYQLFNKEFVGDLRSSIKAEMQQELMREQQQKTSEQQRWDRWVQDSISQVQEQFDVNFTENERNAFLKFVTTYLPTDNAGNVDLIKGWQLYSQMQANEGKEKADAKKALAAKVTSEPKGESKKQDFQTSASLRNKSWTDIGRGSF